jgi:hypothetical protein
MVSNFVLSLHLKIGRNSGTRKQQTNFKHDEAMNIKAAVFSAPTECKINSPRGARHFLLFATRWKMSFRSRLVATKGID